MTSQRAQHDRDVVAAFGARELSRAGELTTYVVRCLDATMARDVRASLAAAGVHVPEDQNKDGNTYVIAYVYERSE